MNRLFVLTLTTFLYCLSVFGQQPTNDSTLTKPSLLTSNRDSLFINFSCLKKDDYKILLQWKADSTEEGDYFVVEHSNDGVHFETVGALKGMNNITGYELTDNAPFSGSNFYRVKYLAKMGDPEYSKTMQVTLSQNAAFKFYPNPVDKLLIVQTDHPASIQILSSLGVVRISSQLQQGVQIINVSALEKGHYILRVTDKESNRDILEQLLKN